MTGLALAAATALLPAAHADPPLHRVTYTITVSTPVVADIYFREADPPTWAQYSHNPYEFSPKVTEELTPDRPWVREVTLSDPDRWAMVTATSGRAPITPMFGCSLSVDGTVVATGDGAKGALCSLRHW
ncbi:hypothetical protein BHQ15_12545 [Mycolicibacillus koreensis]|nr:hypothetical protein BHQ15_12545 [Mycolicibacillus koreensis]